MRTLGLGLKVSSKKTSWRVVATLKVNSVTGSMLLYFIKGRVVRNATVHRPWYFRDLKLRRSGFWTSGDAP